MSAWWLELGWEISENGLKPELDRLFAGRFHSGKVNILYKPIVLLSLRPADSPGWATVRSRTRGADRKGDRKIVRPVDGPNENLRTRQTQNRQRKCHLLGFLVQHNIFLGNLDGMGQVGCFGCQQMSG